MPIDRNTGLWVANGGNSGGGGGGSSKSNPIKDLLLYGDYDDSFSVFEKGKRISLLPDGIGDGSAYFGGSNYAQIANVDKLPYGGVPRSFSIWVYPTYLNNNSEHYLFAYGSSSSANLNIKIVYGSRILFGGWQYDYPFKINNWYHIVVTYDENKEFKIYCNKELVANQQNWSTDTPKGFAFIGGWYSDNLSYPFYGNISNLQVFNRALSADEVTALYNKQEITNGRVLHIPLQYGKDQDSMFISKNFIYDASLLDTSSGFDEFGEPIKYNSAKEAGISYQALPKDNLILRYDFKSLIAETGQQFELNSGGNVEFKKINGVQCAKFDGNSILKLNDTSDAEAMRESRNFTISIGIQMPTRFAHSGDIPFIIRRGGNTSYCIRLRTGSKDIIADTHGGSYGNITPENIFSTPSDWIHVCWLREDVNSQLKLYINGVLISTSSSAAIFDIGTVLEIGGDDTGYYNTIFNGYLAYLRMYDRALTEKEIGFLYKEINKN